MREMMDDEKNTLGKNISALLEARSMSQRELAGLAGVTEVSISRYIRGERTPNASVLSAIANALKTTPDHLLGIEGKTDFESEYYKILPGKPLCLTVGWEAGLAPA